jgi:hypothetical protein
MNALWSREKMKLALAPQTNIARRLSFFEYGHAAAGASAKTLDPPRIITLVLEGESRVTPAQWRDAMRCVVDANPGIRLRIRGFRQRARWTNDGAPPPQVRVIENCQWDGSSHRGIEVIEQTPLPVQTGPATELIIATGKITRVLLRTPHAVMDGMGVLHLFQELFRALRGESLLGTNAPFSDVDLMRAVTSEGWKGEGGGEGPIPLTGGAQGTSFGDVWQRLTLPASPQQNLMGRVAEVAARYAWTFGPGPVRIAVPVNLRRHLPGLRSTMNFSGLLHVGMSSSETADDFRRKVREGLEQNRDAAYPAVAECIRYLPFGWIDRLTGRTSENYLRRKLLETVLITNLGVIDMAPFTCPQFEPDNYYSLPVMGNSFISLSACGAHLNFVVGMPAVYASAGRLERLLDLLREEFSADGSHPPARCSQETGRLRQRQGGVPRS